MSILEKFYQKLNITSIETISVKIELIAKAYRMGKNNSGATPAHTPMSIANNSSSYPKGAIQKRKNKTQENLYSNQLFELQR